MQKRLDKLVERSSAEEYTENIDEIRLGKIHLTECKHNSWTLYIVLFSILFTVNIRISSYFLCFYLHLKKDVTRVKLGTRTQTTI